VKEEEESSEINYALFGWQLKPRVIPLKKSGATTCPLDKVTFILVIYINILRV
jgi:hypothetical protein